MPQQLNNYQVTVTSDFKLNSDQQKVHVGSREQILRKAMSFGREPKHAAVQNQQFQPSSVGFYRTA